MSLPPAVKRDGFSFEADSFYAQCSNQHWHRRASHSELKELFHRADATSSVAKDHPAHWYEAQLIHYGLQPSKTKSVAKLRLLEAFNTDRITVPQHLQALETELRKHWSTHNEEGERGRQEPPSSSPELTEDRAKRAKERAKRPETATPTVRSTFRPTEHGSPGTKRKADDDPCDKEFILMPTRKRAAVTTPDLGLAHREPRPGPHQGIARVEEEGNENIDPQEHRYRKGMTLQDFEQANGSSPGLQDVKHFDRVGGTYAIQTSIEDTWTEYEDYQSVITLISRRGEVWGAYDFGMFDGIMRITDRPLKGSSGVFSFIWRGKENGEGDVYCDDDGQVGQITFSKGGAIKGTFYNFYGDVVSFSGRAAGRHLDSEPWTIIDMKTVWARYGEDLWELEKESKTRWLNGLAEKFRPALEGKL